MMPVSPAGNGSPAAETTAIRCPGIGRPIDPGRGSDGLAQVVEDALEASQLTLEQLQIDRQRSHLTGLAGLEPPLVLVEPRPQLHEHPVGGAIGGGVGGVLRLLVDVPRDRLANGALDLAPQTCGRCGLPGTGRGRRRGGVRLLCRRGGRLRSAQPVVAAVQRGVRSRLYRKGRYSPTRERGTHHFHRLLCKFLQTPVRQRRSRG